MQMMTDAVETHTRSIFTASGLQPVPAGAACVAGQYRGGCWRLAGKADRVHHIPCRNGLWPDQSGPRSFLPVLTL